MNRAWVAPTLLLLVTALAFLPAVGGDFIWDDWPLVVRNEHIKDWSQLGSNLRRHFWDTTALEGQTRELANLYYRPVVTLTYMVDHALYGLQPWGFHLTNLLLHLAVVLLAHALALRVLPGRPQLAFVAALAFAVHPSRAEAVAWVSGRTDLLMALFALAALLAFWRALQRQQRRLGGLLAGWALYVLAVLSKEPAIALALVLPAMDWLLISAGDRQRLRRNLLRVHLPLVLVTTVYMVGRLVWQAGLLPHRAGIGLATHLRIVLQSVAYNAGLVLCPYAPSMQVGSDTLTGGPLWLALVGGLVALTMLALLVWTLRRHRLLGFGLLFFCLTMAPVLNIKPLRIHVLAADRFLYLALWGCALVLALGYGWARQRGRVVGLVALLLVGGLVTSWSLAAAARCADFSDRTAFWRAEVRRSPRSAVAQRALANRLAQLRHFRLAEKHYLRALLLLQRRGSERREALTMLQRMLEARLIRTGDFQLAFLRDAEQFLARLIDYLDRPPGRNNVAEIKWGGGSLAVTIDSVAMRKVLRLSRVRLWAMAGVVRSRLGRDKQAVASLERALALDGSDGAAWLNLTLARARARDVTGAHQALARAEELLGPSGRLQSLRGALAKVQHRVAQLRRLPRPGESAEAQRLLAEIFVVTRAPRRACEHLRRAISLAPGRLNVRAMLAMELAAAGRLNQALREVNRAREALGASPQLAQLERQVRQAARRAMETEHD